MIKIIDAWDKIVVGAVVDEGEGRGRDGLVDGGIEFWSSSKEGAGKSRGLVFDLLLKRFGISESGRGASGWVGGGVWSGKLFHNRRRNLFRFTE